MMRGARQREPCSLVRETCAIDRAIRARAARLAAGAAQGGAGGGGRAPRARVRARARPCRPATHGARALGAAPAPWREALGCAKNGRPGCSRGVRPCGAVQLACRAWLVLDRLSAREDRTGAAPAPAVWALPSQWGSQPARLGATAGAGAGARDLPERLPQRTRHATRARRRRRGRRQRAVWAPAAGLGGLQASHASHTRAQTRFLSPHHRSGPANAHYAAPLPAHARTYQRPRGMRPA
jgi:hypothetical protein